MSQENVELVGRFIDLFNRGDFPGAFDLCDRDVEFDWSRRLLDPAVLHGRDKSRGFIEETLELFDQVQLHTIELIDLGDDVLNISSAHFRGRSSGADVTAQGAIIWTIRDGRISHFRFYQTREDALEDLRARDTEPTRPHAS
jgi:ketosteroid isomerase-like protein